MKIDLHYWVIATLPVGEDDVPDKWTVATRYKVGGLEFIVWERF